MQRQISLTKTHDDKLTALAKCAGISRSEMIRRLIDEHGKEAQRDAQLKGER